MRYLSEVFVQSQGQSQPSIHDLLRKIEVLIRNKEQILLKELHPTWAEIRGGVFLCGNFWSSFVKSQSILQVGLHFGHRHKSHSMKSPDPKLSFDTYWVSGPMQMIWGVNAGPCSAVANSQSLRDLSELWEVAWGMGPTVQFLLTWGYIQIFIYNYDQSQESLSGISEWCFTRHFYYFSSPR